MIKYILPTIIVILIFVGFYTDNLGIESGTISQSSYEFVSKEFNINNIENITGELYTTPQLEKQRINTVAQSNQKLIGEVYNLTNHNVFSLLHRLLSQGTHIQMIVENRQYKGFHDTFKELQTEFQNENNIEFQSDDTMGTEYVHAKFRVTDNHAIIQTANLTFGGLNESKEHQFITSNTGVMIALTNIFNADRNTNHHEKQKKEKTQIGYSPNILVCPINCREGLEKLLKTAKKSIVIRNQYITDQSIRNILKAQKKNNIHMQLLVSNNDANIDLMRYFDHDTAREIAKPYMHTKTMLIDNRYLVLGSINFSSNSMDNNREIAIIITDHSIIQKRKHDFDYYWSQG